MRVSGVFSRGLYKALGGFGGFVGLVLVLSCGFCGFCFLASPVCDFAFGFVRAFEAQAFAGSGLGREASAWVTGLGFAVLLLRRATQKP